MSAERVRGVSPERARSRDRKTNTDHAHKPRVKTAPVAPPRSSLQDYVAKRNFTETPEPKGKVSPSKRLRFVIQKHRATRLHYDFRLEAEGVLKSWAVPKGPSLQIGDRRLAMHVEDHPLDYRDFEGIIPKGNYGAGEVIVWDNGTYTLVEGTDPAQEIAKGKIKFVLSGHKMRGEFTLVRIRGRDADGDPWLLIKDKDEFVNTAYEIEKDNKSIVSGRTVEDLAKDPRARHWISNRPAAASEAKDETRKKKVKAAKLPQIVSPMLATLVEKPFDDANWLFEIKWDGYRAICRVDESGTLSLTSRNGLDFLSQFPELADINSAFKSLPIIVDGEIVSLDERGRSSFQRLQGSFDSHRPHRRARDMAERYPLTFVAFDVLHADGKDLRKTPLVERKQILAGLLRDHSAVMYSKHVLERGIALYKQAQKQQLEGIVGKKCDSFYVERRSRDWVKIKAQLVQECVIGGYTEPRGSRKGFGALLLGLYDGGTLQYAGHVGTGFDERALDSIYRELRALESATSPFARPVKTNTPSHWVKPKLVAQVRFTEWTRDGSMRHPAFLGLRADKDPKSCVREMPADAAEVT